jgi:zinc protease
MERIKNGFSLFRPAVFLLLPALLCFLSSFYYKAMQVNFSKQKLKNGIEVWIVPFGELPVTGVKVWMKGGRNNELPGLQGLAGITAQCLDKGYDKLNASQIDGLLAGISSGINVGVSDEATSISSLFLNDKLETGLQVLSGVITRPSFPADEISQITSRMLTYNKPSRMDLMNLANAASNLVVYGKDHPLGRHFFPAQLKKINRDSVLFFHSFYFNPANCKILVSGNIQAATIIPLLEKHFGDWKPKFGSPGNFSYSEKKIKGITRYFIPGKKGSTQSCLRWNFQAPLPGSEYHLPYLWASELFNEMLFEEIRAKEGKTYGINLLYDGENNRGYARVVTQVRTGVTAATVESFDRVLKSFYQSGVTTPKRNASAAKFLSGQSFWETPLDVADAFNLVLYPNPKNRQAQISGINNITAEMLNTVIKKYFNPANYILVICGDPEKLSGELKQIQGIKMLEISDLES